MEEELQLLQHQNSVLKQQGDDLAAGLVKLNERLSGMAKVMMEQHAKTMAELASPKAATLLSLSYQFMSPTIGNLMGALALSQSQMAIAQATGGSHHKKPFAQLKDLKAVADPVLGKNGLGVSQIIINSDAGDFMLITTLGHSSGEWICSRMLINPQDMSHQKIGAAISYMRRYAYSAIVCVGVDQDGEDPDYNAGR